MVYYSRYAQYGFVYQPNAQKLDECKAKIEDTCGKDFGDECEGCDKGKVETFDHEKESDDKKSDDSAQVKIGDKKSDDSVEVKIVEIPNATGTPTSTDAIIVVHGGDKETAQETSTDGAGRFGVTWVLFVGAFLLNHYIISF